MTMAGRKAIAITDRQFAILRILWERGPLTVRELLELLPRGFAQPYTTVLGLLQSMEKGGLVTHEKENQANRYRPLFSEQEATRDLLSDFIGRFFHGSAERLVMGLVDSQQLDPQALRMLEARLGRGPRHEEKAPRKGQKP
jgi:predicted transcriptional regulator